LSGGEAEQYFQINRRSIGMTEKDPWTEEIWRKILNSVAHKYDCGVRFIVQNGRLEYEGDKACAIEIVKEAVSMMEGESPDPSKIKNLMDMFG
jgi:hypothetical protein